MSMWVILLILVHTGNFQFLVNFEFGELWFFHNTLQSKLAE